MKRITWFVGGVAAGAAGANYAKRKVRQTASQFAPAIVARTAIDGATRRTRDVADAVREGRVAMYVREDELRARRDGRLEPLDAHVGPDDTVLVDGQPVEADRITVLRNQS